VRDRRDEIAGFGPGIALAVGLGVVSGAATVVVLVAWIHLAGIAGTFRPSSGGIAEAVAWWALFWLALSLGMLASLWLGYRVWHVLYPAKQRLDETREEHQAIAEAEAIVEEARSAGTRDR